MKYLLILLASCLLFGCSTTMPHEKFMRLCAICQPLRWLRYLLYLEMDILEIVHRREVLVLFNELVKRVVVVPKAIACAEVDAGDMDSVR